MAPVNELLQNMQLVENRNMGRGSFCRMNDLMVSIDLWKKTTGSVHSTRNVSR